MCRPRSVEHRLREVWSGTGIVLHEQLGGAALPFAAGLAKSEPPTLTQQISGVCALDSLRTWCMQSVRGVRRIQPAAHSKASKVCAYAVRSVVCSRDAVAVNGRGRPQKPLLSSNKIVTLDSPPSTKR